MFLYFLFQNFVRIINYNIKSIYINMLNIENAKELLLNDLQDFNIKLKTNNKGIITISFINKKIKDIVNLKFNEKTNVTTIAPREMDKESYKSFIKPNMENIKNLLIQNND